MAWARFSVFSQRFKHLRLSTLYDILFQPRFLVATYEQRYVKLSDSNIGFEAAWRAFVRSAKVERLIVELVATTFVAYVFDMPILIIPTHSSTGASSGVCKHSPRTHSANIWASPVVLMPFSPLSTWKHVVCACHQSLNHTKGLHGSRYVFLLSSIWAGDSRLILPDV